MYLKSIRFSGIFWQQKQLVEHLKQQQQFYLMLFDFQRFVEPKLLIYPMTESDLMSITFIWQHMQPQQPNDGKISHPNPHFFSSRIKGVKSSLFMLIELGTIKDVINIFKQADIIDNNLLNTKNWCLHKHGNSSAVNSIKLPSLLVS